MRPRATTLSYPNRLSRAAMLCEGGMTGKTVLVVDDDEAVTRGLERILTSAGYRVICVAGYSAALRVVDEAAIDVLLTDFHLEGAKGDDLIRQVLTSRPATRTILLTGDESVVAVGTVLRKPIRREHLLRAIDGN